MVVGENKCLSEIYDSHWSDISNPTSFGKIFKNAVRNRVLINIMHIGIRSTGRCDEYERTHKNVGTS
jgi:hypothetical protein